MSFMIPFIHMKSTVPRGVELEVFPEHPHFLVYRGHGVVRSRQWVFSMVFWNLTVKSISVPARTPGKGKGWSIFDSKLLIRLVQLEIHRYCRFFRYRPTIWLKWLWQMFGLQHWSFLIEILCSLLAVLAVASSTSRVNDGS